MRTVEHEGERYLLVKRSDESSLVRDPETGDEQYLPNDELEATGDSPLTVAAERVPSPVRKVVTAVHSEQTLGVLVELDERGPLSVREILGAYDLCESDIHGTFAELRAAGLVEEATVNGERGYGLTEGGKEGLAGLRD
ncbi:hypothetical protein HWV23_13260 [Natronomonas halophila]|uniref:DUF7346 family protein n=1 Tax=Natronomonas halophila TaxID=2747817 RepID=UPI0015B5741B|nr:hypothetical protein [Natronomonas halophila]QLD86653.1 hypothetical protein HWV23_13260 [Natronomonas halophila]